MLILNLGCGTKISASADVINIDWSMYFRMKRDPFLRRLAPFLLIGERLERFNALPDNIKVHNLARGIPFGSDSVDMVYHSHLFEHLDKNSAQGFLMEIRRVLKTGGVIRIVVPDLESLCRKYLDHISLAQEDVLEKGLHDTYIASMIEQCVRKEAYGTSRQPAMRRWIENIILGDARRRGETHQWMYDKVNLGFVLLECGFKNVQQKAYDSSLIVNWQDYGLDLDQIGNEYKPDSLYMEAQK